MSRPLTLLALAAIVAVVLGGCGIEDPYEKQRAEAATERAKEAERAYPEAEGTPAATLRRVALLAGNWTSADAPAVFGQLTLLSTGEARADFEEIAATAGATVKHTDAHATVEAVTVRGAGDSRSAIVVTRTWYTNRELANLPPEYNVTLATVERRGGRWVIVTWRPQQ
jgi:hypothetical protein